MASATAPAAPVMASLPPSLRHAFWALAGAGTLAFLLTLRADPARAWPILLVNFLFWSGISQAGVAFSAMLEVSNARWGRPLERIAEATVAFMPLSFGLLLVLLFGWPALLPWLGEPAGHAQPWLRQPAVAARQTLGLLLLYGASGLYVRASVRRDPRLRRRLAPAVLLLYALVLSLLAFDWVMSLDPRWLSTLIGGYFFIGNAYLGIAALVVLAAWGRARLGLADRIGPQHFHDLGKLLLAFCMLWTYLFFSQYLPIWYANLPEETGFLLRRGATGGPWRGLALAVLLGCFVLPFLVLLSRAVKRSPRALLAVALLVAGSLWLERYLLVVPSLWPDARPPIGLPELLISAAFLAVFALGCAAFLDKLPRLTAETDDREEQPT